MTSRILVTGGAGFIGSTLVDALIEHGHRVAVLDNLSTGRRENVHAKADLHVLDLCRRDEVLKLCAHLRPDIVFHLAAQASVKVSVDNPALDAEVNVLGGINLLDGARAAGTRRIIFSSTGGAIYGNVASGEAEESWPVSPASPYAASKAAFELYLKVYQANYGLASTVLRFANVYGPRQDPHGEAGVVAIFSSRLSRHEPVTIYAMRQTGDDGCLRDYVYVGDVVAAGLAALDLPVDTYNVATGVETTTAQVLNGLADALGVKPIVSRAGIRPGDVERSVLSPTKLKKTGWQPRTSFAQGLAHTAQWFSGRSRS